MITEVCRPDRLFEKSNDLDTKPTTLQTHRLHKRTKVQRS